MADTYCGKTCEACTHREALGCPGCKAGPGHYLLGDCELAGCCRDKGHQSCDTCNFGSTCPTLRRRGDIPEYRRLKAAREAERREQAARSAAFLGKWLWYLFWLVIPANIAELMTYEKVTEWFPSLDLPGQLLSFLCSLAYGLILLKVARESDHYRTSGLCGLAVAVLSLIQAFLPGTGGWALLLSLPAAGIGLWGTYHEFLAHGEVLSGVNNPLAKKWTDLWKWHIGIFLALFGGVFVMVILPVLSLLVILAASIATVVIAFLKLVYLYQTANFFRNFPQPA